MIETDEVLLRRARRGESAAFVDFATRWWPAISRVAWSMLGSTTQAVAVTEEVIRTALESAEPPRLPVACSLYRLAIWLAIIRRRSSFGMADRSVQLLAALDELDNLDRAAFLLREVEHVSASEAATILEIPASQLQARIHRARVGLTQALWERRTGSVRGFDRLRTAAV